MTSLSIDLSDPGVQRMLGSSPAVPGKRREIVQLAGDAPDPTGMSALRGAQSTTSLCGGKHEVVVLYRDTFMTVDVYLVPGAPPEIHIICPRCHKASRISGDQKAIDYDPRATNPVRTEAVASGSPELAAIAGHGRLSVEPFECTWEVGGDKHVAGGVHTGASLCRQKLAIDDNRAKDA